MPDKLHEAVRRSQEIGLPIVPFAEGKVPGTGLSIAVSEYMQGVSNPQMTQDTCADCGHEVCPEGCPCANPDCPGKKNQRPNGRMMGAEPLGGMAHEVRKASNLKVSEGTVVEIDGDKVTIWKDGKQADQEEADLGGGDAEKIAQTLAKMVKGTKVSPTKSGYGFYTPVKAHVDVVTKYRPKGTISLYVKAKGAQTGYGKGFKPGQERQMVVWIHRIETFEATESDPIRNAIKSTTQKLQQEGNSATVSEMQSGLAKWLQMCRQSKRVGNDKRAASIMAAIEKVVVEKALDEPTVFNWTETFEGALTPEYSRSDFSESINDRNLFKAVFTAGGPGSGKSFIAGGMFKGTGARFVNSDIFFEYLLKKKGLPFNIDPSKKMMYGKQMAARGKGKKIAASQAGNWINGMLPLVVDGTGRDIGKIKKQKQALEKLGYDTSMVFVNTTLDVAINRNQVRKRSVPDDLVKKGWEAVQKNIGAFQSLFSGNMMIVDNSVAVSGSNLKDLKVRLARAAMKMLGGGLRNQMGRNTVAELQKQGGKYISDIDPDFGKADHIGI